MRATTRHAAKAGNSDAEYEDAYRLAPTSGEPGGDGPLRVAVADGASESLLAGRWAGALAEAFAAAPGAAFADPAEFAATVAGAADGWPDLVAAYVTDRERRGSPLRWYERPGLAKGAFATLLAVEADAGGWRAAAIGDTCLFHVRDGALLTAFPVTESGAFGTAPPLLGTRGVDPELVAARTHTAAGGFAAGDALYACTDALAAWVLARVEDDVPPWTELDALLDAPLDAEAAFAAWLDTERTAERMGNDDVTLARVVR